MWQINNRGVNLQCGWAMSLALAWVVILSMPIFADPPQPKSNESDPRLLTLQSAIVYALENNPQLAAIRQLRGIAAAAVVIAETYPFNPIWEGKVRGDGGPADAGITNRVPTEHTLLTELEIRGQRAYRRQGADAALS